MHSVVDKNVWRVVRSDSRVRLVVTVVHRSEFLFLCLNLLFTVCSGRNGANDREQRARERERFRQIREQQLLNALVQHANRRNANPNANNNNNNNNNNNLNNNNPNFAGAMNNAEGQPNPPPRVVNVVVRAGNDCRNFHGNTSASGACKRKSTSYGPESVECWASSEVIKYGF